MCATGVLWEQSSVPLLQQLEDQGRRTQVPLNFNFIKLLLFTIFLSSPLGQFNALAYFPYYFTRPNQMLPFWWHSTIYVFMYFGVSSLGLVCL